MIKMKNSKEFTKDLLKLSIIKINHYVLLSEKFGFHYRLKCPGKKRKYVQIPSVRKWLRL